MARHLTWITDLVAFDDWASGGSGPRDYNVTGPGNEGSTIQRVVGTFGVVAAVAQLDVGAKVSFSMHLMVAPAPFPLESFDPSNSDRIIYGHVGYVLPVATPTLNTSPVVHGAICQQQVSFDTAAQRKILVGNELWLRMDPRTLFTSPSNLSNWALFRLWAFMRVLLLLPEGVADPGGV